MASFLSDKRKSLFWHISIQALGVLIEIQVSQILAQVHYQALYTAPNYYSEAGYYDFSTLDS